MKADSELLQTNLFQRDAMMLKTGFMYLFSSFLNQAHHGYTAALVSWLKTSFFFSEKNLTEWKSKQREFRMLITDPLRKKKPYIILQISITL